MDFSSYSRRDPLFYRIAYDYSYVDWEGLCDHLRDVLWEDIFKLSASMLLVNFVSEVRLEFIYMSLIVSVRFTYPL